jgi:hypothetical protein
MVRVFMWRANSVYKIFESKLRSITIDIMGFYFSHPFVSTRLYLSAL